MISTSLNKFNPNVPDVWKPIIHRLHSGEYNVVVLSYNPAGYIYDGQMADRLECRCKPLVVFNFEEHGWDKSHSHMCVPGLHYEHYLMHGLESERIKLHEFLGLIRPAVYFLREFSKNIQDYMDGDDFPVYPIDLINTELPTPPEPNEVEYKSRQKGVFHWYGESHPDRSLLAELLNKSDIDLYAKHVYHLNREPIGKVLNEQSMFMASVSLPGAGAKCWRDHESTWNSVPIAADLGVKRLVEFNDSNAIMLPTKDGRIQLTESINKITECIQDVDGMWVRMQNAHKNAVSMQVDNYMAKINSIIKENL